MDYTEKTEAEIKECIKAQKELVDAKYPGWHLAPHDGICFDCGKNIYQNYGQRSGRDGTGYITGCPHCNRSYCD